MSNCIDEPSLGNYLGQFTNETPGDYIVEFVAAGLKNYAFNTFNGQSTCKKREFTLNFKNAHLLNFNTLKQVVQGTNRDTITTNQYP